MTATADQLKQHTFRNLVFEGGGAKGSAYAGAVQVLDEHNLLDPIQQIAGTSAGAITAALLATGGGSAGLMDAVEKTDFAKFIQDKDGLIGDAVRVISHYGFHTGDEFVSILKGNIKQFSGSADLTFSELAAMADDSPQRFKRLTVIASNLTKQRPERIDANSHPNLPIWHAVRASISIPIVFEPVQIGQDMMVDGGLAWNFPIDLFDTIELNKSSGEQTRIPNDETLGFFLEPHNLVKEGQQFQPNDVTFDSLKGFGMALSTYLYTTANSKHIKPCDRRRTVFIDDLGISATDFSIPANQVDALIESGREATNRFFSAG